MCSDDEEMQIVFIFIYMVYKFKKLKARNVLPMSLEKIIIRL